MLNLLVDLNGPALQHLTVEGQFSTEALDNITQHVGVGSERVGVEARHHTTSTKILNSDDDIADAKLGSGPQAFSESVDTANDEVRPKPATISSKCCDGTVGGDQERQD